MTLPQIPVLSLMVWLPVLGAALLYLMPSCKAWRDPQGAVARALALTFSLLTFLVSLGLAFGFEPDVTRPQFLEKAVWIKDFGISYALSVDGISLFLVLLTTLLVPLVVLSSTAVQKYPRGYLASMLLLETAMLGTLLAADVFLFYAFWELMLAPMYFLIGIWGGARRIYATLKFVLYTVAGSLLMLVALFYLVWSVYAQTGVLNFSLHYLLNNSAFSLQEEIWLFAALALAFAIKIPLFPLHTWLPDAHVEAPTGGSVILAGVLLKMGLYGLIRFAWPLFPRAAELFAPYIALLAVIGIVYGALVAWAQSDIKKLIAYSSVSHLGYCVLGFVAFSTLSITGSVYQMLNHGVSTGALFLLVGALYERRHTREISEYGGLASQTPRLAALFLVFTLSSIALPLTNGFVGEFLILTGSFPTYQWLTGIALLGVVLGAVYMLTLYLKTMFGELNTAKNGNLKDLNWRELLTFAPLFILVFWMGIYPAPFLRRIEPAISNYIFEVNQRKLMLVGEGLSADAKPVQLAPLGREVK